MKNFFKYVTASCLGTLLALGGFFLIIMAIAASSTPKTTILSNSTLHLKLDHLVPELTDNSETNPYSFEEIDLTGLNDIKKALVHAASDDKISSLYINTEYPSLGQATALSIYNAIDSFKQSGKPIIAYGEYMSQNGYLFASLADTICINPLGNIDIKGFGTMIPYFGELIREIGGKVDIYHAGRYKSAIEPYYREDSSDPNDYQTREFLADFQDEWLENITRYRPTTPAQVLGIISSGEIVDADIALDYGLVDRLMHWEDFEKLLLSISGRKKYKLIDMKKYVSSISSDVSSSSNRVAVIYMEGEIRNNTDNKGMISMDSYEKVFDRIAKDDKVKAVVLRVNSPGGDAFESEIIWDRVEELKNKGKYVVASYGDYAASGGYYISCGADEIISQPNTLTGSIGAFGLIPDLSKAIEDHLKIHFDTIGTGRNTFMYTNVLPRTKEQNRKIQAGLNKTYDLFKKRVAEGRGMTMEEVEKVAQGRVWSGEDAVGAGLVDQVGDLDLAINVAAAGADIEKYKIKEYPFIEKSVYEELFQEIMASEGVQLLFKPTELPQFAQEVQHILHMMEDQQVGKPQCRLPFIMMEN